MDDRRPVSGAGRELEDSFFAAEDREAIARLQKLRQLADSCEALAQASGIRDQAVLEKLVKLGVRPETIAPLALVPVLEVAWADGGVDAAERQAVLAAAAARGIQPGEMAHEVLHGWLTQRPPAHLFEAWEHYVAGLCQGLSEEERRRLRDELVGRARHVAEASGGFLGLGNKVSAREATALERVSKALGG